MVVYGSKRKVDDKLKFPGFFRNIREYCSSLGEYKRKLKEKGLIEIGFDDFPDKEEDATSKKYWTDDILKELAEEGVSFDGELIKAMQSGRLENE